MTLKPCLEKTNRLNKQTPQKKKTKKKLLSTFFYEKFQIYGNVETMLRLPMSVIYIFFLFVIPGNQSSVPTS